MCYGMIWKIVLILPYCKVGTVKVYLLTIV
jgi:hypothetical protein